jgi:hypothetical protein
MEYPMPVVVNVPGTENIKCTCCKTWLDHWKKHSKKAVAGKCKACGKANAVTGGHVKRFINDKGKTFIVPMCQECMSRKEQMDSFLVAQEDFVYTGACFEDLDDISETDDADTE